MQYHYTVVQNEQPGAPQHLLPNPLGLTGGILGIVAAGIGLLLGLFLPFVVAPIAAVAVAFSAEGLRRSSRYGLQKGWAITGLATAIPSLALSGLWLLVMIIALATGA